MNANKVSISEMFDAVWYLNKMAKIVPPKKRLISNSLFYKVKAHVIMDFIKKAHNYNVATDKTSFEDISFVINSIDFCEVNGGIQEFMSFTFKTNDNKIDIHTEVSKKFRKYLDKNIPDWEKVVRQGYIRSDDMPEFDEVRYKNSFDVFMKYIYENKIFLDILNTTYWTYEQRLIHIKSFYPNIKIEIKEGKIKGKEGAKAMVKVYVNDKVYAPNVLFKTFCNKTIAKINTLMCNNF